MGDLENILANEIKCEAFVAGSACCVVALVRIE
jgi:hypothetical protein